MEIINSDNNKKCLKNVKIGSNVFLSNFINAYECTIEAGSKIGSFVEIQKNASIGKNCKISSHTFICEGVTIKDNVFIGRNVSFINDKYPRAVNDDGSLKNETDWEVIETFVEEGVSIGTSATILCGITIGKNSFIGAGSVVTKNVPENSVVAGNPAKVIKNLLTKKI